MTEYTNSQMRALIAEHIHSQRDREMDQLEEKFSKGAPMSVPELEHIDKMAHALKSLATYEAMKGNSEYGGSYDGGSYARGRSRMTGRYVSRDGGYSREGERYPAESSENYGRRY